MELRQDVKDLLNNKFVMISKNSVEEEKKFKDSSLLNCLRVDVWKNGPKIMYCKICNNITNDCCWNCDKEFCDKYSYAIAFDFAILSICLECKNKIIENQIKISLNNKPTED